MLGESAWKKQQSMLEEDANNLSILKKQIVCNSQYRVNSRKLMHQCNFQSTKKSKPSSRMPPYSPKSQKIKSTRTYDPHLLRLNSKPSSLISEISSKKIRYRKLPFAIAIVSKVSVGWTIAIRNWSMIWDNSMAKPIASLKMSMRRGSKSIRIELKESLTLEFSEIFKKNLFSLNSSLRNYLYKRSNTKRSMKNY